MPRTRRDGSPYRDRTRAALTDRFCTGVRPEPVRRMYWDRGGAQSVVGLVLVVEPSGRKSFRISYRLAGRARWFKLDAAVGRAGPGVGVEAARSEATLLLQRVRRRENPIDPHRVTAAMPATVEKLIDAYIESIKPTTTTWDQYRRLLYRDVVPTMGALPPGSVTPVHIENVVSKLIAAGKRPSANAVITHTSALFNWAMDRRLTTLERNPAKVVKRVATNVKHHRAMTDAELKAWWVATAALFPSWRDALRLLLLTGQRTKDIRGMRWDRIDADGVWHLKGVADESDLGMKAKRPHIVPFSRHALAVLDGLREDGGGDWVFSGNKKGKPVSDSILQRAMRDARPTEDLDKHGLRSTHSTIASRLGFGEALIERAQGRVAAGKIHLGYNQHLHVKELRHLHDAVADYVLATVGETSIATAE